MKKAGSALVEFVKDHPLTLVGLSAWTIMCFATSLIVYQIAFIACGAIFGFAIGMADLWIRGYRRAKEHPDPLVRLNFLANC